VIVVADTSVLLNLCRIGQVELLARLFHQVVIPLEVSASCWQAAIARAHGWASAQVRIWASVTRMMSSQLFTCW
jgi:predicted nucleic acid-binding protein